MTSVSSDEGWLYRERHKDLGTRKIVGCARGARMTKHRAMKSLLRAVKTTKTSTRPLHHADSGSPYGFHENRRVHEGLGMKAFLSGTGNCFDNAPTESFWATQKTECIVH